MTESVINSGESIRPQWRERLLAARQNAYAPYSRHAVAALIVTESGQTFFSCNVESAHYKSVCAEAGAISAMVTAGETRIREVWVLGPGPDHCPPCGDCRQRIHEFADTQTLVHLINDAGRVLKSYSVAELLPEAFGGP
ncbi:MAG: cytidine deaminase [Wenzhouxiangella sp.]|jgi:cytidine deaminase|nr:cytidine deaminase [Wenzhouxiangella sp.]